MNYLLYGMSSSFGNTVILKGSQLPIMGFLKYLEM